MVDLYVIVVYETVNTNQIDSRMIQFSFVETWIDCRCEIVSERYVRSWGKSELARLCAG
jgi:hypothetical protein